MVKERMQFLKRLKQLAKKRAIRHGGAILVDHGLISVAMFITSMLVARSTSKSEYGSYVLMISLIMVIQGAHRALISLPFTVLAPRMRPTARTEFFSNTLIFTFIFGFISILISLFFVYSSNIPFLTSETKATIIAASFTLLPYIFREHFRSAMLAQLNVWGALIPSILATVIHIITVIILFFNGSLSTITALNILALSSGIAALSMLLSQRQNIRINPTTLLSNFSSSWVTAKWNLSNVFWAMGSYQIYPWLIAYLLNADSVGSYGAAFTVSALLTPLLRGANSYILPRLAHSLNTGGKSELLRLTKLSMLVLAVPFGLWFAIGLFQGGNLLSLFFSDRYSGYGLLVGLLISRALIEAISTPLSSALQALEKTKYITISLILSSLLSVGPGLYTIKSMGLVGAGIVAVSASTIAAVYRLFVLKRIVLHGKM